MSTDSTDPTRAPGIAGEADTGAPHPLLRVERPPRLRGWSACSGLSMTGFCMVRAASRKPCPLVGVQATRTFSVKSATMVATSGCTICRSKVVRLMLNREASPLYRDMTAA